MEARMRERILLPPQMRLLMTFPGAANISPLSSNARSTPSIAFPRQVILLPMPEPSPMSTPVGKNAIWAHAKTSQQLSQMGVSRST